MNAKYYMEDADFMHIVALSKTVGKERLQVCALNLVDFQSHSLLYLL